MELCGRLSVFKLFYGGQVVRNGPRVLHLICTSAFHVKAENEIFTAADSRFRENLKLENFTSLFGRLRQKIAPKGVPHVQHVSLICVVVVAIAVAVVSS